MNDDQRSAMRAAAGDPIPCGSRAGAYVCALEKGHAGPHVVADRPVAVCRDCGEAVPIAELPEARPSERWSPSHAALVAELTATRAEAAALREACKTLLAEVEMRFKIAGNVDDGCSPEWRRLDRLLAVVRPALAQVKE